MDRDLHELIDGADSGPVGDAGEGWAHIGMRWRPRPEPTAIEKIATGLREFAQPQPIVIHINPAVVDACRQLNEAFRQGAVRLVTELAAGLERARKERS